MKEIAAYLIFNGNCREAMEFYAKCLGAEMQLMTYGQTPMKVDDATKDRVVHARLPEAPRP